MRICAIVALGDNLRLLIMHIDEEIIEYYLDAVVHHNSSYSRFQQWYYRGSIGIGISCVDPRLLPVPVVMNLGLMLEFPTSQHNTNQHSYFLHCILRE